MSVKPAIIRMRERCSTLVVAAAADDEGDGEGTEIKLISFALPVAYSGLWRRWIGSVVMFSKGNWRMQVLPYTTALSLGE